MISISLIRLVMKCIFITYIFGLSNIDTLLFIRKNIDTLFYKLIRF